MGNKGGGHGQRKTNGGGHGNGKQRGRAQARETKRAHGRARATGNKESPREGMGNGKQREPTGNKTQGNKGGGHGNGKQRGRAREGTGNGKQRGKAWATGNKWERAWATGNKGGGHGNGKQRGLSPHHRKALGWLLVATLYWWLRRGRMTSHVERAFGRCVMFVALLRGSIALWLGHNLSGVTTIKRGSHGRGSQCLVRA